MDESSALSSRLPPLSIFGQLRQPAWRLGTPDEPILEVAPQEGRLRVSHDRKTMPTYFASFIASQSSPGVFIVLPKPTIAQAPEWLILYWSESEAEEHINLPT
jgi:hypothetical protein